MILTRFLTEIVGEIWLKMEAFAGFCNHFKFSLIGVLFLWGEKLMLVTLRTWSVKRLKRVTASSTFILHRYWTYRCVFFCQADRNIDAALGSWVVHKKWLFYLLRIQQNKILSIRRPWKGVSCCSNFIIHPNNVALHWLSTFVALCYNYYQHI